MKLWQKIALITLAMLLILGVRVYFVFKGRQDPGIAAREAEKAAARPKSDEDVEVRELYLNSFDGAKQLEGTTVWVKAGYSLPYYPYTDGKVEFAQRVGVLPSAEKLAIAKLVKAKAPPKEENRVAHGTMQYFAVFAMPDSSSGSKTAMYAAPIGYADGNNEALFIDQLFYYDAPKTIYDQWPKSVWDAVAAHTPQVGMSEVQTRMAVGILAESDSKEIGNRTVTYDTGGKKWTVSFANGKATSVKQG